MISSKIAFNGSRVTRSGGCIVHPSPSVQRTPNPNGIAHADNEQSGRTHSFAHWELGILWSLVIGHWSFEMPALLGLAGVLLAGAMTSGAAEPTVDAKELP